MGDHSESRNIYGLNGMYNCGRQSPNVQEHQCVCLKNSFFLQSLMFVCWPVVMLVDAPEMFSARNKE